MDDGFGFPCERGKMRCQRINWSAGRGDQMRGIQECRQAERTQAEADAIQKLAAGEEVILEIRGNAAAGMSVIVRHTGVVVRL